MAGSDKSYNYAKLMIHYDQEAQMSKDGWDGYFEQKTEDDILSDQYELGGSIVGGLTALVLSGGNPYAALVGYNVGKQAKYLAPSETDNIYSYMDEHDLDAGSFELDLWDTEMKNQDLILEQEHLAELIASGTDFVSAYLATDGFSKDLISMPSFEDGKFMIPEKTLSGKEIPTAGDYFKRKLKGTNILDNIEDDLITDQGENIAEGITFMDNFTQGPSVETTKFNLNPETPWDAYTNTGD